MKFFTDIILQGKAKLQASFIQLTPFDPDISSSNPPISTSNMPSGSLYIDQDVTNDNLSDVDGGANNSVKRDSLKYKIGSALRYVISSYEFDEGNGITTRRANCFNSRLLNINPVPKFDSEAASKFYVDSLIDGLAYKEAVRAATVSPIDGTYDTTTGKFTLNTSVIDTVSLQIGNRVLVKDETDSSRNGIYEYNVISSTKTLTRSSDADASKKELMNAYVLVSEGSKTNKLSAYVCQLNRATLNLSANKTAFTAYNTALSAFIAKGRVMSAGIYAFEDTFYADVKAGGVNSTTAPAGVPLTSTELTSYNLYKDMMKLLLPTSTIGKIDVKFSLYSTLNSALTTITPKLSFTPTGTAPNITYVATIPNPTGTKFSTVTILEGSNSAFATTSTVYMDVSCTDSTITITSVDPTTATATGNYVAMITG